MIHHRGNLNRLTTGWLNGQPLERCHGNRSEFLRYRHVLVAARLNLFERDALRLGFDLASVHESQLTLLHVLPHSTRAAQGLNALGLLHAAADRLCRSPAVGLPGEATPKDVRQFVEDSIDDGLLRSVDWRSECRRGRFAETILSFIGQHAADVVILPASTFRWRLPFGRDDVWAIQRRIHAKVIVIRS